MCIPSLIKARASAILPFAIGIVASFHPLAKAQINPLPPALLNTDGASDTADAHLLEVATDENGVWVAVWNMNIAFDQDIFFARSIDNGTTWSTPALLNDVGVSDGGDDVEPVIRTDRAGNWIVVWQSTENLNGTAGGDWDVFVSRSIDDGETWSPTALLNSSGTTDFGPDQEPTLSTDGAGNWVAAWQSSENLNGTAEVDWDIFVSRSSDNGATWSMTALLNSNGSADAEQPGTTLFGNDYEPTVTTDGAGNWVATWESDGSLNGSVGFDFDLFVARSTDNGANWTSPALLNTNGGGDGGADFEPALATDKSGGWLTIWASSGPFPTTSGSDIDIFASHSVDNGTTWSVPVLLNTSGTADVGTDNKPVLGTDKAGRWVAVWQSAANINGTAGTDNDIVAALSTNLGEAWSTATLLNTNGTSDIGSDQAPAIATDGNGIWLVAWESNENLNGTAGTDDDVLESVFSLSPAAIPSLSGHILAGDMPASCAAIEAIPQGGGAARIAVTDETGKYLLPNLDPVVYDIRIYSSDAGETVAGPVDLSSGPVSDANFALTPNAASFSIRGRITDTDTGEPLVGVLAEALSSSNVLAHAYTCASGNYLIVLPPGTAKGPVTIDLRFSTTDYATGTIPNVDVPADGTEVDATLTKSITFPSTLVGAVFTAENTPVTPLSGVRVTLRGPANVSSDTDIDGYFVFPAILGGTYTISASAVGYLSQSVSKTVQSDGAASEFFVLVPGEEDIEIVPVDADPNDINGDTVINAVDIQLVINGALGIAIGALNADVNGDNAVNAVDVQLVINAALGLTG